MIAGYKLAFKNRQKFKLLVCQGFGYKWLFYWEQNVEQRQKGRRNKQNGAKLMADPFVFQFLYCSFTTWKNILFLRCNKNGWG